jgi:hypothetical protein
VRWPKGPVWITRMSVRPPPKKSARLTAMAPSIVMREWRTTRLAKRIDRTPATDAPSSSARVWWPLPVIRLAAMKAAAMPRRAACDTTSPIMLWRRRYAKEPSAPATKPTTDAPSSTVRTV